MKLLSILVISVLWLAACDGLPTGAFDNKFGDQHFKSAIAAIELHKIRNGEYPAGLKQLEFVGAWDLRWISSVRYERTTEGYNLFAERGWIGVPSLTFPSKFRSGLGLRESNIEWDEK